jgi:hypothetical protein
MLDEHTLQTQPKFKEMKNIIHQDEKWFNATRNSVTYYMTHDEEDPHRTVRNKNYIEKVMFLCAVANPQYDEEENCTFDDKLGIWPFIREVPQWLNLCALFASITLNGFEGSRWQTRGG